MTWDEAQKTCSSEAKGARLPIFTNGNDETTKLLMGFLPGTILWIGGTDADQEGEWAWFYGDGTKTKITAEVPWEGSEPNGNGGENCMMRIHLRPGKFGDIYWHTKLKFLCQLGGKGA